jgi:hypothetical protein
LIYGGDASQEFENNELHFDNKGSEESGTAKILIPCVLTTTSFYGQGKRAHGIHIQHAFIGKNYLCRTPNLWGILMLEDISRTRLILKR